MPDPPGSESELRKFIREHIADVAYWLARAEQMRQAAKRVPDEEGRRPLLRAADIFTRLAERIRKKPLD